VVATEARPRATTISADIAIFFMKDPSTRFERPDRNGKNGNGFTVPAASGQWMLGAGAASLESIELGPQQQALGWVQFMLRRESAPRPSLDVIALTLLNSPHSFSAVG
jgi:hypothetical protein